MEHPPIPHTQLPHVPRLFTDYLYHFSQVREFYALDPFREESYEQAARSLPYADDLRREVLAVLKEQNQRFSAHATTFENLKRLEKPGCFAVVTGQQVGLFTGPAYALYKALTAVKVAEALTGRGLDAVPVFWLVTEDHDFAEVNHCFLQDREGHPQLLEYSEPPSIPDAPVGTIRFSPAIQSLLETLPTLLPDSLFRDSLLQQVSDCYRPGESFGGAFGRLILRLFAEYGVIVVDPLEARLHALSSRVFRAAIESASSLLGDLLERNRRLSQAGYPTQVRVAEDSSLLFYFADGRRLPLRLREGQFVSSEGRAYSPEELLEQLQREPVIFSPNVLLRSVMQDSLLPTLAYVGGPSELAYLAQAAPLHQRILGRMPVLFPRASFTLLDPPASRLLAKYDLTPGNVYEGKQTLREKMAARFLPPGLAGAFQKATGSLEHSLEEIRQALAQLDPTLAEAAATSGRKMHHQLSTLERKAAAAIQNRSEQVERDAQRLENHLYPQKTLQERFYCGIEYLARYGPPLLARLSERIPLDSSDHQIITIGEYQLDKTGSARTL